MVKRCSVRGCSNSYTGSHGPYGVSFHSFPADEVVRNQWITAVRSTKSKENYWRGPRQDCSRSAYRYDVFVVCSDHFTDDSFDQAYKIKLSLGITARRKLIKGAVPSIFNGQKLDKKRVKCKQLKRKRVKAKDSDEVKTFHQCIVCNEMFEQYSELEVHNKTHVKIEQVLHNATSVKIEIPVPNQTQSCIKIEENDNVPQHGQQEIHNKTHIKIEQTDDVQQHGQQEIPDIFGKYDQLEIHNKIHIKTEQTFGAHQYAQQELKVHNCAGTSNTRPENVKLDKHNNALTLIDVISNNGVLNSSRKILLRKEESISTILFHQCRVCEESFKHYCELEEHCQIHLKE